MVSNVNIHSWGKLRKPCMALKEQAFQSFSNVLISMENAEKSYFAVLICFLCVPQQGQNPWKHTAAYLKLSGSFCLAFGLEDLERQNKRANKCTFYQGWLKRLNRCPLAVLYIAQREDWLPMPTFEPRVTAEVPREPLPGTPGSIRLSTLKTLSASKLGVKYSLFILDSNSLIFGDWEDLCLNTYYSLFLPWQEDLRSTEHLKQGRMEMCQRLKSLIAHPEQIFMGFGKQQEGCSHLLHDCLSFPAYYFHFYCLQFLLLLLSLLLAMN